MKRKRAVRLSTKKSPRRSRKLEQIEQQLSLLLVLLQHNIAKVLHHKRAR